MCHHCVTDAVKRRMLSRRDLLRAAPAIAAAASAAGLAARAFAAAPRRVEDLTHALHPDFPTYFGEPGFSMSQKFNFADHGFNLFDLAINEHTGTHVDAPMHFSADGQSVDEIPVENLVAPLAVVDIRAKAAADDEAQVTPDDIRAWMDANGDLPARCCVAMLSGWADHLETENSAMWTTRARCASPASMSRRPEMLIEEADCIGIAVDTLSLDIGSSADFATHYAWLPTNRWGIENLAGLDRLPAKGATLMLGAPKHRGGSGGPARVVALV